MDRPKIAVGAPVGNDRAWVLDRYLACLAEQTFEPDYYCFVLSPGSGEIERYLRSAVGSRLRILRTEAPFFPRLGSTGRTADPADPNRAQHFCRLRNRLVTAFSQTDADVFFSLDTDVLLEEPTVTEELVRTLYGESAANPRAPWAFDAVAPLLSLHPRGLAADCYNAGWFVAGLPGDPQRVWRRADQNDVASRRSPVPIDIPLAAYVIRRHALLMCRYHPHELGEDMGFADAFGQKGFRAGWRTDLKVRHVWGPEYLEEVA